MKKYSLELRSKFNFSIHYATITGYFTKKSEHYEQLNAYSTR